MVVAIVPIFKINKIDHISPFLVFANVLNLASSNMVEKRNSLHMMLFVSKPTNNILGPCDIQLLQVQQKWKEVSLSN